MRKNLLAAAIALLCFAPSPYDVRANEGIGNDCVGAAKVERKLADGLYIVARNSQDEKKVAPLSPTERLLVDDGRFLDPEERDPAQYVVVDVKQFVPFAFEEKLFEGHEPGTNKPLLKLQFAAKQASDLEELTGKNVGNTVAIVVDGQVVTCHKIREAIKGGKLQITRCTKVGCDLIYSHLLQSNRRVDKRIP